jgi:hypothetical protein
VINLAINVVELAANVFQYADLDAVIIFSAKQGMYSLAWRNTTLISDVLSYGVYDPTKDIDHSRRTNREVFILIAWVSDAVRAANASDPGMTSFWLHPFSSLTSLPVNYTRSVPRVAGLYLSIAENETP